MASQTHRTKLTKGYVDRIKPGPKDEFHWCIDPAGFGVRVTPTGGLTFIVQGRVDGASSLTHEAGKRSISRLSRLDSRSRHFTT